MFWNENLQYFLTLPSNSKLQIFVLTLTLTFLRHLATSFVSIVNKATQEINEHSLNNAIKYLRNLSYYYQG